MIQKDEKRKRKKLMRHNKRESAEYRNGIQKRNWMHSVVCSINDLLEFALEKIYKKNKLSALSLSLSTAIESLCT